jgi:hypothetical protein
MKSLPITRGAWRIVLLCALIVACGKYGPPRRVHDDPREVEATEIEPSEAAPESDDEEGNSW